MLYHLSPTTEMTVRLSFFFCGLIIMMLWEYLSPRRVPSIQKKLRWSSNIGIAFINSFLVRVLFPTAAVGVALYAEKNHVGFFNKGILIHPWVVMIISIIILDFVIYLQHVMFHAIPLFWRFHRMHHVDLDFDVTTGIRFHPIEIILSLLIKFMIIILIGAPAVAVMIFEVLLNATSMFSHSNINFPLSLDKIVRWLFVTPDMHRVHHSVLPNETNSNFGFNLSIWDRCLGTYKDQPRFGHSNMTIGIQSIRQPNFCIKLFGMLWVPFLKENHEYPINRKQFTD